jgi:tetratricopeptide (TPR) repeat protein
MSPRSLEGSRERFRCGEREAAQDALRALLDAPEWPALDTGLQGRLLRTAALYQLAIHEDIDGARELARRAERCDPNGDGQVLAAHIALRSRDSDVALTVLQPPRSLEARHLKAAILIEARHADDALKALDLLLGKVDNDVKPSAETWRLRALAFLALGRLIDAAEAIEQAKSLAPDWLAVRSATAVVAFWHACTPAALKL